jgi:cytochrome c
MRRTTILRSLSFGLGVALVALGSSSAGAMDDEAAKALLKKSDCTKCHAIDKDKKGPSYQKIAATNKGKADAEARLTKSITTAPKVKLADGTEEEHKRIETKDAQQIKGLVQWILAQ